MEQITVFTMPEIYKKANEYATSVRENSEVEFIEIGILEKGGALIRVHYKFNDQQYLGLVKLPAEPIKISSTAGVMVKKPSLVE